MGLHQTLASVDNFFWTLSIYPYILKAEHEAKKVEKDPAKYYSEKAEKEAKKAEKEAKKAEKETKKEDQEEIKKAVKEAKENGNNEVPEEVDKFITEMSDDNIISKTNLTLIAIDSNKMVQYAFYYMTNPEAKLITTSTKLEKELINGIGELVGFGKIYEDEAAEDLKKYDPSKEEYTSNDNYIFSIDHIIKLASGSTKEQMNIRRAELESAKNTSDDIEESVEETSEENTNTRWKKDENGIIHPVFFTPEGEETEPTYFGDEPIVGPSIPVELFNKLESDFGDLLPMKHRYQMLPNNLVQLYVTRDNGMEEYYTVDPGVVMGLGKTYILANIVNDTIFVCTEDKDVCRNVLSNVFYTLTPDEVQTSIKNYFRNMKIYKYIDMSNTEKLAELNQDDFQKLGKKITFILNQIACQYNGTGQELPRLRFADFQSVDNFMLISDISVISPFMFDGTTSPAIHEGLIYQVDGDNITQRLFGNVVEFHIDKYGEI